MNTFPSDRLRKGVSVEDLTGFSKVTLSILHQELTRAEKPTRFKTHRLAVAAVQPLLEWAIDIIDTPLHGGRKKLNYPFRGHVRKVTKSKVRPMIRLMLRPQGATLQECMIAGRFGHIKCRAEIRSISVRIGYGVREDDDGRIYLHTEKADARDTD